jgi:hypothetical protein
VAVRAALANVALLLLCAVSARAVELQIEFKALERMLGEQVFSEEGRRYVKGTKSDRCNFAYLESPKIESDGGRLRIRAKFTGRSSLNVLGQCVGLGDAFQVVVTARPVYKDGQLRLQDVSAAGDRTGFYIRRVCTALAGSLATDFKYPLEAEAKRVLEDGGRREVHAFKVPEVRVSGDALVLTVDFELRVR